MSLQQIRSAAFFTVNLVVGAASIWLGSALGDALMVILYRRGF